MALADDKRKQLDGIVQQMQSNKESEQNIQAVVSDFKGKYEGDGGETQGEFQAVLKGFGKVGESIKEAGEEVAEIQEKPISPVGKVAGTFGQMLKPFTEIATQAVATPARVAGETVQRATGFDINEATAGAIQKLVEKGMDTQIAQDTVAKFRELEETNPEAANALAASMDIVEFATIGVGVGKGAGAVAKGAERGARATGEVAETAAETIAKGAERAVEPVKSFDEVVRGFERGATKPEKVEMPRTEAVQAVTPEVTIKEKIVGLRPDIKKRLEGKTEKFDEYIDVLKARELSDEADSPLAHAAKKVVEVRDGLQKKLSEKGGEIGEFRKKVGTTKAKADDIQGVLDDFDAQISKKGLNIGEKNKIGITGGRETVLSNVEIGKLQEMRDSLLRLKGDPTATRIIDNRTNIDKKINFAKQAREISNEIDPISRSVRTKLKQVNEKIIGKEQSSKLAEFSGLSNLLDDLNKLTSKGSNSEFLLKRVLSERDRLPKEVLSAVKRETGVDLLDEAQLANIVTELSDNPQVKGLFEQEIKGAGLDIVSMISPKVGGALQLFQAGAEKLIDKQQVFREATKGLQFKK